MEPIGKPWPEGIGNPLTFVCGSLVQRTAQESVTAGR
jgi:hypothetical protein